MEYKKHIDKELQTEEVVITGEPEEIIKVLEHISGSKRSIGELTVNIKADTTNIDEVAKELMDNVRKRSGKTNFHV